MPDKLFAMRPPLKKSLFPVQRVAEIWPVGRSQHLFFFRFFFLGKKIVKIILKKRKIVENEKKRSQSALIDSPGRWTGNNIFSKGGLMHIQPKKKKQSMMHIQNLPFCDQ